MAAEAGPQTPVCYLATGSAEPLDPFWARRVAAHAQRRPPHWRTVETRCVSEHLQSSAVPTLIDDLGTWLTAAMDRHRVWLNGGGEALARDVDELVAAIGGFARPLVLVSPEVVTPGQSVHVTITGQPGQHWAIVGCVHDGVLVHDNQDLNIGCVDPNTFVQGQLDGTGQASRNILPPFRGTINDRFYLRGALSYSSLRCPGMGEGAGVL